MQKLICLSLAVIINSGCASVTLPNTRYCTAAGLLRAGANCGETLTNWTGELTRREYTDFLQPQFARECAPVPGTTVCADNPPAGSPLVKFPERGGAVCESAEDWNKKKTALEQACRILGKRCPAEIKVAVRNMKKFEARLALSYWAKEKKARP